MTKELQLFDKSLVSINATSLQMARQWTYDEAKHLANGLFTMDGALQWWLGDFLNSAEAIFGEDYTQLVPEGYKEKSLQQFKWVSSKIPPRERRSELSYSHHMEVAKLESDERIGILENAIKDGLTVRELRQLVRPKESRRRESKTIVCPECGHEWEE